MTSRYGAVGTGLGEKMKSVQSQLPREIVQAMWPIIKQRNTIVHEGGELSNRERFTENFERARAFLEGGAATTVSSATTTPPSEPTPPAPPQYAEPVGPIAAPTQLFVLPALILAILLHLSYRGQPGDGLVDSRAALLVMAVGAVAWLAAGGVAVLVVQLRQWRRNRTPLLPGLVLLYGTAMVWVGLTRTTAGIQTLGPSLPGHQALDGLFGLALPSLAILMILVAVTTLVLRRPLPEPAAVDAEVRAGLPPTPAPPPAPQPTPSCPQQPVAPPPPPAPSAPTPPTPPPPTAKETDPLRHYRAVPPTGGFADLYGAAALKQALTDAGHAWHTAPSGTTHNGILLFGPPGTGKTAMATALAHELGLRIIKVTFGDLASRWINQTTEQLMQAFKEAVQQAPVMLFFDEVDAVLRSRESTGSYAEYERTVAAFLDQVVAMRDRQVLVVAATNYIDRLDTAAIREGRFDDHIEVPLPDSATRHGLITECLRHAHCTADDATLARLVHRWGGFAIPRILEGCRGACALARTAAGRPATPVADEPGAPIPLDYDCFYRALRRLQGRKGGAPEGAKSLDELFLDPALKEHLESLATQLRQVDALEQLGGHLPRGVLFYGPPGTGKTAAAMALARASDWSFLVRNGRELTELEAIAKLRKEASDLRPAIVFIDEADDILGERTTSTCASATNELLTLIDGAGGLLPDVVWIAATNHPDQLDTAATRGGRFGQKVAFDAPAAATGLRLVTDWITHRLAAGTAMIDGTPDAWAAQVYPHLHGLTPADIYHVLDTANNQAITNHVRNPDTPRTVTLALVLGALADLRGDATNLPPQ